MSFGMIMWSHNRVKEWNCVIWIQKNLCIYKDIADNLEIWFDTSAYEIDEPLPKGQNKNVIGLMEGELRENHAKICCVKSKKLQLLNT